jgi:hypothetical protein
VVVDVDVDVDVDEAAAEAAVVAPPEVAPGADELAAGAVVAGVAVCACACAKRTGENSTIASPNRPSRCMRPALTRRPAITS